MKIVHLADNAPRSSFIINQGLSQLNYDYKTNKDYISLGKVLKEKSINLDKELIDCDLIFAGDDSHDTIIKLYYNLLTEKKLWNKVIWYDFRDKQDIRTDIVDKIKIYFKRSISYKDRNKIELSFKIFPIDYCILDEFIIPNTKRDINVSYLFSENCDNRRKKVLNKLKKYNFENSLIGYITGDKTKARKAISDPIENNCFIDYLNLLSRSKIVFTTYPCNHDGDSRTWEAFASGALVFKDISNINIPNNFIKDLHYFEFNALEDNSIDLACNKAMELLKQEDIINSISKKSLEYAIKFHKASNRVNYMIEKFNQISKCSLVI